MDDLILEQLKQEVLMKVMSLNDEDVIDKIQITLNEHNAFSVKEKLYWSERLTNHILKYDVLQPLLDNPDITEIMVNGLNPIFVEKKGDIFQTEVRFSSKEHLNLLIQKIATEIGREVNFSKPIMDARLKDGSRVNVILDPVAINGPILTIRKFLCAFNDPNDLIQSGMLSPALNDYLKRCFQMGYNIFIAGGTGSGKTTFLNCMSKHIPDNERVIIIEDASEIKIEHIPNLIHLETRQGNNQSPISTSDLIKNALRMRPDRIIVGEVRSAEVIDMLQAMNTGHDGSLSTGHSNSALDMLIRLEVIAATHSELDTTLIRKQIISAIDLIVYIERLTNGKRVVSYVGEVDKKASDYILHPIYSRKDARTNDLESFIQRSKNTSKLERLNDH